LVEYSSSELGDKTIISKLDLDSVVMDRWNMFMQKGYFRYNSNTIKEKVVEGRLEYLAQCQLNRAKLRRPPQSMLSIKQKFDKEKFNFNKIDESKELVCQLVNKDRARQMERDILIINVSPADNGHSLLVPQVEAGLPQVLTNHSILLSLEVMKLSTSPHIKMAFNSLCAYASVNHLHWHLYYQPHNLPTQSLPLSPVQGTPYHVFTEYPARAWVWLVKETDNMDRIEKVAREVVMLTSWLTDKDVAHNAFITRGAEEEGGMEMNCVRLMVWARESVVGAKDPGEFVMAALELSGQVLVYTQDKFENIVQEEVVIAQKDATERLFKILEHDVENIFMNNPV